MNTKKEIGLLGIGLGLNGVGLGIARHSKPFTAAEIAALKRSSITPRFDRRASFNWSVKAAHTSDILLYSSLVTPASVGFSGQSRTWNHAGTLAVMGAEAVLLSAGLTQVVKNIVQRPRPFTYNPDAPTDAKLSKDARRSFFSGHTSLGSTTCFYTAQVFSDLYPQSKWRYAVWSGAAILPMIIGYQRYKAGKHFPTDIAAGYVVGALCGILVPKWHNMH